MKHMKSENRNGMYNNPGYFRTDTPYIDYDEQDAIFERYGEENDVSSNVGFPHEEIQSPQTTETNQ